MNNSRQILLCASLVFCAIGILILVSTADFEPSTTRKLFGAWRGRDFLLAFVTFIVAIGILIRLRSKEAMLSFILVCGSTVFIIGLLEASGHFGLISWSAIFTPKVENTGQIPTPNITVKGESYQDTATRWGIFSDPIPFDYRTDENGYRNRPNRSNSEIYLIGDSILVGGLVEAESIFASRLEDISGKTVMQVALVAKSPQEMQFRFTSLALKLKNKLVLQFIFEGNDLADSRNYRATTAPSETSNFFKNSFLNHILVLLQHATQPIAGQAQLQTCTIGGQVYTFLWIRNSFEGLMSEAPEIAASLEQQRNEVEKLGGRYAVVYVPSKLRVLGDFCYFPANSHINNYTDHLNPLYQYLFNWGQESGIPVIDLTPALVDATAEGRMTWFWGDTHWNAEGHSVAAEVVANWVALQKTSYTN